MFRSPWRIRDKTARELPAARECIDFPIGTEVWVKPAVPSCTKKWSFNRVPVIQLSHVVCVCVDGVPRHVCDVCKRVHLGSVADA